MTIAEKRTAERILHQHHEHGTKKMVPSDSLSLLQHIKHNQDSSPLRAINTVKFLKAQSVS